MGYREDFQRQRNRLIAKLATRFPFFGDLLVSGHRVRESKEIPWTPVRKALRDSVFALVTTAGVHHRDQKPFDMKDPSGDPSFRTIDARRPFSDLMITHDYYDHTDADRDTNIVFPLERLREFENEGIIGRVADTHYGFMGHIRGPHIETLIARTAPEVAGLLRADAVDGVLLTPG